MIGFTPETDVELADNAESVVPGLAGSGTIEKPIRLTGDSAPGVERSTWQPAPACRPCQRANARRWPDELMFARKHVCRV